MPRWSHAPRHADITMAARRQDHDHASDPSFNRPYQIAQITPDPYTTRPRPFKLCKYGVNLGTLLRTCDAVGACLAVPKLPWVPKAFGQRQYAAASCVRALDRPGPGRLA